MLFCRHFLSSFFIYLFIYFIFFVILSSLINFPAYTLLFSFFFLPLFLSYVHKLVLQHLFLLTKFFLSFVFRPFILNFSYSFNLPFSTFPLAYFSLQLSSILFIHPFLLLSISFILIHSLFPLQLPNSSHILSYTSLLIIYYFQFHYSLNHIHFNQYISTSFPCFLPELSRLLSFILSTFIGPCHESPIWRHAHPWGWLRSRLKHVMDFCRLFNLSTEAQPTRAHAYYWIFLGLLPPLLLCFCSVSTWQAL